MYRTGITVSPQRKVVKTFSFKNQLQKKYQPILDNIIEEDLEGGRISFKKWVNEIANQ